MNLAQLHYRGVPMRPLKKADIDRARALFLDTGKGPRDVKVSPVYWQGGPLKAWKHDPAFGQVGKVKAYARPDWTYCDYDAAKAPTLKRFFKLGMMLGIKARVIEYDRTRKGWHVLIRWNRKFSPAEIVAMQAILGSDFKRERFNLVRVLSGKANNSRWNLLFEFKL